MVANLFARSCLSIYLPFRGHQFIGPFLFTISFVTLCLPSNSSRVSLLRGGQQFLATSGSHRYVTKWSDNSWKTHTSKNRLRKRNIALFDNEIESLLRHARNQRLRHVIFWFLADMRWPTKLDKDLYNQCPDDDDDCDYGSCNRHGISYEDFWLLFRNERIK